METLGPVPWARDVANPLKYVSTHLCYRTKFGHVKPFERKCGDLLENFEHSRLAFQCHSRLLEPTRIDRLPMTSY